MNPSIKAAWIETLLNTPQATHVLRDHNGYCAMGCLALAMEGKKAFDKAGRIDGMTSRLPKRIWCAAGLESANPTLWMSNEHFLEFNHLLRDLPSARALPTVAFLNDAGVPLDRIAELVADYL